MKKQTQGFTLIELLIVIAIIGILASVLIPNLMNAQKKGYDAGAINCGKSLQTAEAISYANDSKFIPVAVDISNASIVCQNQNIVLEKVVDGDMDYAFKVSDKRGSRVYTFTPSGMRSDPMQ